MAFPDAFLQSTYRTSSVHHLVRLIWEQVKVTAVPSGIPMADIYDTAASPG